MEAINEGSLLVSEMTKNIDRYREIVEIQHVLNNRRHATDRKRVRLLHPVQPHHSHGAPRGANIVVEKHLRNEQAVNALLAGVGATVIDADRLHTATLFLTRSIDDLGTKATLANCHLLRQVSLRSQHLCTPPGTFVH